MKRIGRSVGNDGVNLDPDVRTIQTLLNQVIGYLAPVGMLKVDGLCGPVTIGVIIEFQRRILDFRRPDGRIDPSGKTLSKLNELAAKQERPSAINADLSEVLLVQVQQHLRHLPLFGQFFFTRPTPSRTLTKSDFTKAAASLGIEVATIKAVASVESAGGGFLDDGRPKILFEGHWFSKLTAGKYDKTHPTISYPRWTKAHYKGGSAEYSRLTPAVALNKEAAWKATSWGKFQIMGFNHKFAGYSKVQEFVVDMKRTEGHQLMAFVEFIKSKKLDVPLKAKDWATFAKAYNGPKYAENKYDVRLAQAYKAFSA